MVIVMVIPAFYQQARPIMLITITFSSRGYITLSLLCMASYLRACVVMYRK
jgi:hypothetical protein